LKMLSVKFMNYYRSISLNILITGFCSSLMDKQVVLASQLKIYQI